MFLRAGLQLEYFLCLILGRFFIDPWLVVAFSHSHLGKKKNGHHCSDRQRVCLFALEKGGMPPQQQGGRARTKPGARQGFLFYRYGQVKFWEISVDFLTVTCQAMTLFLHAIFARRNRSVISPGMFQQGG